jgi:tetratricopeptide (TPR) repeat protein
MTRRTGVVIGVLAASLLGAQQADPRTAIDAHLRGGRYAEAERVARAGGAPLSVALGEVLVLRGQLASAESILRAVVATRGPEMRIARVTLAELALRRGDRRAASDEANTLFGDYQRTSASWSARELVAAGRAYLLVSLGDAEAVRSALRAFDRAAAKEPGLHEAALRASDLLLEKYNGPDAEQGFAGVLQRDRANPWALLGVARVMEFKGEGDALGKAREALEVNPSLVPAHLFIARLHLEAEREDSAMAAAQRALAVDPSAVEAYAVAGAVAWIRGDSAGFRAARAKATELAPRSAAFFVTLADAAARQRRYADAERFSAEGLALDSLSVPALGALGTNSLRGGRIAEGRAHLENAFAIDPFNLWHKNTLDMLDVLATFRTVPMGRFEFVAPSREAELLLPYLSALLEEAYDKLARRYDYQPPTPVRLEIYERHADFSVRTVGLTGLGALGVSFGRVLAMDAPSARPPGTFNWGSTAWHELTHTFTLGLSGNRVPRWFSEGASVLEERRARAGWGAQLSEPYVRAWRAGKIRAVSELNDGFVRPREPQEVMYSYYHASLVCEMIEAEFGAPALPAMLRGWRDGLTTDEVFRRVLKLSEKEMDKRFEAWLTAYLRGRTAPDTIASDAALQPLLREVAAREVANDDAGLAAALEKLLWVWPYDAETHTKLAAVYTRLGQHPRAVLERRAVIALGATDALEARYQLARALLDSGDRAGARREVLGILEQAPTFVKAQTLLLDLRRTAPPGGGR